ncbi:hypothetical protein [Bradyrhizobium sp.]|uniref:hypothetical protein n=1 Tax=Bradyrhizobium sp. TaxID=376 RepID=UPI0039E6E8C2
MPRQKFPAEIVETTEKIPRRLVGKDDSDQWLRSASPNYYRKTGFRKMTPKIAKVAVPQPVLEEPKGQKPMTEPNSPRFRPVSPADMLFAPIAERPLPAALRHDWEAMAKLVKEADPAKLNAICEVLDIVNWAAYEADTSIDDARLFLALAVRLAEATRPAIEQRSAANAKSVNYLLDLAGTLQARMVEAIGLIDAARATDARTLLDAQVLALDKLDTTPIEQR